jgi:hypothetical protein
MGALIAMEGEGLFWARHYPEFVDHMLGWLAAQQTDPAEYEKLHKGTPFYYLGMAAFLSHDYQSATFFFDAAASEDFKVPNVRPEDQPAHLFMCLNPDNSNQAALEIVRLIVQKLNRVIGNYNHRDDATELSIDIVRDYFLRPQMQHPERHHRTLVTTFISFLAEWHHRSRMIDLGDAGSKEPFFTHLLRGCLLFESLLKENPKVPVTSKTSDLEALLRRLGKHLGVKGPISTSCADFDGLVCSLREREPLSSAILSTAKTRNMLSHNVVWISDSLSGQTYDLLAKNIVSSCLHAIATLYVATAKG